MWPNLEPGWDMEVRGRLWGLRSERGYLCESRAEDRSTGRYESRGQGAPRYETLSILVLTPALQSLSIKTKSAATSKISPRANSSCSLWLDNDNCVHTVWAKLIKGWCWAIFRQIEAKSSLHESSSLYQKNYWQISLQLPAGWIKTNQTKFASRHSQILLQNLSQFISIVIIYWEKLFILMYRIIKVLLLTL